MEAQVATDVEAIKPGAQCERKKSALANATKKPSTVAAKPSSIPATLAKGMETWLHQSKCKDAKKRHELRQANNADYSNRSQV